MNKKQGYMGGGYGTNISPMDMKNKSMMDEQMRTPRMQGGMMMSKGKANIAAMEKMCSAKAGMNSSVSSK
tara:strand:+ start:180 stop:389 length:210 start_codon:yes stop_codon:yes gene_type:complete